MGTGISIGSAVVGDVVERWGTRVAFTAAACCAAAAILAGASAAKRMPRATAPQDSAPDG